MYHFGICGMGKNGFMTQLMSSQAAADNIIAELKLDIERHLDPNLHLANMDLSMITELDQKRIVKEVERYAKYGY